MDHSAGSLPLLLHPSFLLQPSFLLRGFIRAERRAAGFVVTQNVAKIMFSLFSILVSFDLCFLNEASSLVGFVFI